MAAEKILDRVQKLLNQANGTDNEAERETFFEKASALMLEHQINESMLAMRAGQTAPKRREPIFEDMEFISTRDEWSDLLYTGVCAALAAMADVRLLRTTITHSGDTRLRVFGFEDQVGYFRMLWISAYQTFSTRLFPKWDAELPLDTNVYAMVNAGLKWLDIYQAGHRAGQIDFAWPDGGRLKRAFRREAVRLGEEVRSHTNRNRAYRESYALGFAAAIKARAEETRRYREDQVRSRAGAEVALRSDFNVLNDFYARALAGLNAGSAAVYKQKLPTELSGQRAGSAAGHAADLSGGRGHVRNERKGIEG